MTSYSYQSFPVLAQVLDVNINQNTLANGNIIKYNSTTGLWDNSSSGPAGPTTSGLDTVLTNGNTTTQTIVLQDAFQTNTISHSGLTNTGTMTIEAPTLVLNSTSANLDITATLGAVNMTSTTASIITANDGFTILCSNQSLALNSTNAIDLVATDAIIISSTTSSITSQSTLDNAISSVNGTIFFYTGSSPQVRMTINNTGRVGIGTTTPNANSMLDLTSTTKAFLPPRMTTTQKNAIPSPTAGMVIYDNTLNKLCVYTTAWQTITSV